MTHATACRTGFILGPVLALTVSAAAQAQQLPEGTPAGQNAYPRAEDQRRAESDAQRQLAEPTRSPPAWPAPRYAPTLADAYRSGYIYGPRRMYRQAVWYGYPPLVVAAPRIPTDFFGYPMYGPVRSATGYENCAGRSERIRFVARLWAAAARAGPVHAATTRKSDLRAEPTSGISGR